MASWKDAVAVADRIVAVTHAVSKKSHNKRGHCSLISYIEGYATT